MWGLYTRQWRLGIRIFSSYAPISIKPVGGRPVIHGAFDTKRLSTVGKFDRVRWPRVKIFDSWFLMGILSFSATPLYSRIMEQVDVILFEMGALKFSKQRFITILPVNYSSISKI